MLDDVTITKAGAVRRAANDEVDDAWKQVPRDLRGILMMREIDPKTYRGHFGQPVSPSSARMATVVAAPELMSHGCFAKAAFTAASA